jgi:hypothetical protein
MIESGEFNRIMLNPASQFGRRRREYLGARFLPERLVPANKYTEGNIKYRTVVANDGSRYSPAQKKGNMIAGTMEVSLGDQDIAAEFTSEDYDNFIAVEKLNTPNPDTGNPEFLAMATLANWVENRINLPLIEKVEKMRWEAIVDAAVPLSGDNGYAEIVNLSNPSGHRFAAVEDWTDPADNPLDDIYALADVLDDKDYAVGVLIAGRPVIQTLLAHPKVVTAVTGFIGISGGTLESGTRRVTLDALNAFLAKDDLPPLLSYNLKYRKEVGTEYFLKRNVMVGLALTGRNANIDLGDDEKLTLEDTLGYVGVGRPAGAGNPGRMTHAEYFGNKPPRAEFEGWQTSFPVIQDPEAVAVITSITTA